MNATMRAWWFQKQGLHGFTGSPADALSRSGWARAVGGSNPYLTLFARTQTSKESAERAVIEMEVHELPCARGCTYLVPREDFALALKVGQGTGEQAAINTAIRHLGVTSEELERLEAAVYEAVAKGALEPREIREAVGDLARNLGDEGKKRGQTTTLPLALGRLQSHGFIRRIAINGRLDTERFRYGVWNPNPLAQLGQTKEEALVSLAAKFWRWIGPARIRDFQWFAGLGVGAAKKATEPLDLVVAEDDFLILRDEHAAFNAFHAPKKPAYALVSAIDAILLLRRDAASLVDQADLEQEMRSDRGLIKVGGIQDLSHNAILDRGRLIGLWEFDPDAGEVVYKLFRPADDTLLEAIGRTEAFIRDQLGDARSFSLDSPESRKPAIAFLRGS
jgi:hypothetical protein